MGAVLAALALAVRGRANPWAIVAGALVLGLAEIAIAPTRALGLAVVFGVLVGAGGVAMAANGNSTIQVVVPDRLRGRVMSVYTTVFVGSTPIGGLATGAIASAVGVPAAIALGGAVSVAAALAGAVWLRSIRARQQAARHVAPVCDDADR